MALEDTSLLAVYQDEQTYSITVDQLKTHINDHELILMSPNGTYYRLVVADDGTLSTTVV